MSWISALYMLHMLQEGNVCMAIVKQLKLFDRLP
jgi:hypothetical protein